MTGSAGNRAIARSTATSYLRLAVTAAVQFAMVPLLLGHLGAEGYAQYALMLSVLGFLALLELGAGAGAVRAAAAGTITGPAERNRLLSAQLAIGLATGGLGAIILLAVAPQFGRWFGLPAQVHDEVTLTIVLLGLRGAVLAWPFGVLRSALFGHGDAALVNLLQAAGAMLTGGLAWLSLAAGHGLVGFAAAQLIGFLVEQGATAIAAFWRMPELSLRPDWRDRAGLRQGLSFGGSQLLVSVAGLVLLRTDPIIIQAFLPLTAVASYAVALRIADQSFLLTKQFVNALSPLIASLHAGGAEDRLRRLALRGTRYALLLALVPAIPLAVNADRLLSRWAGPDIAVAGPALAILVVAMALMAPQMVASSVLTYSGRHGTTAKVALLAMPVNVVVSLALVRPLGLTGVALGTMAAVLMVDIGVSGRLLCRTLALPPRDYWRGAFLPVAIPALLATLAGVGLRAAAPAASYALLGTQAAATAAVLLLTALHWTADPADRATILARLKVRIPTTLPALRPEQDIG